MDLGKVKRLRNFCFYGLFAVTIAFMLMVIFKGVLKLTTKDFSRYSSYFSMAALIVLEFFLHTSYLVRNKAYGSNHLVYIVLESLGLATLMIFLIQGAKVPLIIRVVYAAIVVVSIYIISKFIKKK